MVRNLRGFTGIPFPAAANTFKPATLVIRFLKITKCNKKANAPLVRPLRCRALGDSRQSNTARQELMDDPDLNPWRVIPVMTRVPHLNATLPPRMVWTGGLDRVQWSHGPSNIWDEEFPQVPEASLIHRYIMQLNRLMVKQQWYSASISCSWHIYESIRGYNTRRAVLKDTAPERSLYGVEFTSQQ